MSNREHIPYVSHRVNVASNYKGETHVPVFSFTIVSAEDIESVSFGMDSSEHIPGKHITFVFNNEGTMDIYKNVPTDTEGKDGLALVTRFTKSQWSGNRHTQEDAFFQAYSSAPTIPVLNRYYRPRIYHPSPTGATGA